MAYVYVLKSERNSKRYVGSTRKNPRKRLAEHNSGCSQWTKSNKPFKLIYVEPYTEYHAARKRELFLKSGQGRKFLDNILGS